MNWVAEKSPGIVLNNGPKSDGDTLLIKKSLHRLVVFTKKLQNKL